MAFGTRSYDAAGGPVRTRGDRLIEEPDVVEEVLPRGNEGAQVYHGPRGDQEVVQRQMLLGWKSDVGRPIANVDAGYGDGRLPVTTQGFNLKAKLGREPLVVIVADRDELPRSGQYPRVVGCGDQKRGSRLRPADSP